MLDATLCICQALVPRPETIFSRNLPIGRKPRLLRFESKLRVRPSEEVERALFLS